MNYRKAQAALEFLTTYAWVFLVIIVMIAAVAYLGVLRPGQLLPERCDFGHNFECTGYEITYGTTGTNGQVKFQIRNDLDHDVYVDSVTLSTESAESYVCIITDDGTKWNSTGFKSFTSSATCNSENAQFSEGTKGKVLVKLTYYNVGASAFTHVAEGEIYATVR